MTVIAGPAFAAANATPVPTAFSDAVASGNVQNLEVTGLSGDDHDYDFEGEIVHAAAFSSAFNMEPNQLATNQTIAGLYSVPPTSAQSYTDTVLTIASNDADGRTFFCGRFTQATGKRRGYFISWWQNNGGDISHGTSAGEWDATTVITSLRIHATLANAIRTGSWLRVRQVYP